MTKFLPIILAVVAGLSLATQQLVNANLRTALSSPAWAGFASFGLFGLLPRPAELMRLVGVIFLITGVVLIRQ
jgi:uncharacterized membrane protein YdcZ (DUF606 family)